MVTENITEYYSKTASRNTRADLVYAVSLIASDKIAIGYGRGGFWSNTLVFEEGDLRSKLKNLKF